MLFYCAVWEDDGLEPLAELITFKWALTALVLCRIVCEKSGASAVTDAGFCVNCAPPCELDHAKQGESECTVNRLICSEALIVSSSSALKKVQNTSQVCISVPYSRNSSHSFCWKLELLIENISKIICKNSSVTTQTKLIKELGQHMLLYKWLIV